MLNAKVSRILYGVHTYLCVDTSASKRVFCCKFKVDNSRKVLHTIFS